MALSELHNRLEHLVSYSSQLIFVSGDAIAKQQYLLESFLELQSNNTEVAFFRAAAKQSLPEYRRTLCSQLLSHTLDYSRPLNELLASLNQHEGPIIISISQAENLPDRFLQELWELVLQSRFAKNKQHLNVLLFGQPDWAKRAKNWLPSKNNGKPLLLSNENVPEPSQNETDLEKLIAQKRREFDLRLQTRAQQQVRPAGNPKWLWLVAILVFFSTFVGILAWQYGKEIEAIWRAFEADFKSAQPVADNQSQAAPPSVLPVAEEPPLASQDSNNDSLTSEQTSPPASNNPLVTDWQIEVQQMQEQRAIAQIADENTGMTDSASLTETGSAQFTANEGEEVIDYPVEDIVSVDQLAAQNVTENSADMSADVIADVPIQPAESVDKDIVRLEATAVAANERDNLQIYRFDEQAIIQLSEQAVVIQIAAMSDRVLLGDFLSDNQLNDNVWVYGSVRDNKPWYVVLHKQTYANNQEALRAIETLSSIKRRGTPFLKSIEQVNREIASAMSANQ